MSRAGSRTGKARTHSSLCGEPELVASQEGQLQRDGGRQGTGRGWLVSVTLPRLAGLAWAGELGTGWMLEQRCYPRALGRGCCALTHLRSCHALSVGPGRTQPGPGAPTAGPGPPAPPATESPRARRAWAEGPSSPHRCPASMLQPPEKGPTSPCPAASAAAPGAAPTLCRHFSKDMSSAKSSWSRRRQWKQRHWNTMRQRGSMKRAQMAAMT